MLEKIKFQVNEPVSVVLRHAAGKIVDGRFGQQVYYTLSDGQCMYLDLDVAQKINLLEVQAGECLFICKRNSKVWDVWLSPETEKMRAVKDRGSIEERLRASVTHVNENRYAMMRVPVVVPSAGSGGSNGKAGVHTPATTPAPLLADQGNHNTLAAEAAVLVDAFAEVLEYSLTTYGGRVKPDDVRSLLLTVYIGRQKGGARA